MTVFLTAVFVLAPNPQWNWTQSTKTQDDFERFCDFFCLFFMFLRSTLKKLVSFLYINVQELFPCMKSLQPFFAIPRFWPLLSLTFFRKWSRVFAIAFSLNFKGWITLADVEVIYKKDTKLSKLFTIYISLWLQRRLQRNRFFLPIGKFVPV